MKYSEFTHLIGNKRVPDQVRSAIAILLPFLIVSAAWTSAVQAAFYCDLAYEVLPAEPNASYPGGEKLLPLVAGEAARARELLDRLIAEGPLSTSPATLTWGGWRGRSNPAIHLTLRAATPEDGWPAAQRLAEQLAWLYRQEAVLLACSAPDENQELLPAYRVTAEPPAFFAQTDGLFAFFGTLMAFAQEVDLGYTRLDDDFWMVDFTGDLEEPLQRTIRFFEDLGAESLEFTLEREWVAVALVGAGEETPDLALREHRRDIETELRALPGQ